MGQFTVKLTLAHPVDPSRQAEADLIVDTGATLSWVPREVIERIGAPHFGKRQFLLADGRKIERDTATAVVKFDGVSAGVTVVIAEPGDGHLLGATTLETLGFAVDPIRQKLVPQTLLAM